MTPEQLDTLKTMNSVLIKLCDATLSIQTQIRAQSILMVGMFVCIMLITIVMIRRDKK